MPAVTKGKQAGVGMFPVYSITTISLVRQFILETRFVPETQQAEMVEKLNKFLFLVLISKKLKLLK
jgi:hypothetical protein